MFKGIEVTMEQPETYHLCAMALSSYTEILGGMVSGYLRVDRRSRVNYEAFLPYLGEGYVRINNELHLRGTSLFKEVRSKLVHEFNPTPSYAIFKEALRPDRIGIEYTGYGDPPKMFEDENGMKTLKMSHPYRMHFYLKEYYRDFKNAVEKYYTDLIEELKIGDAMEHVLNTNFHRAVVYGAYPIQKMIEDEERERKEKNKKKGGS